jgi:hypothetical protein
MLRIAKQSFGTRARAIAVGVALAFTFLSSAYGQPNWVACPGNTSNLCSSPTAGTSVGIGTTSPAPFASLDVNTTGKAFHVLDTTAGGVLIGYQGATIQGRTNGDLSGNLYLNYWGGYVGIGTMSPQHLLHVNGTIGAIEVIVSSNGADYVFNPNYRLRPLTEVASFIKEHHHLPEIPSEAEVKEKGVSVGDMQAKLLAKIEELTLHMIQADEKSHELQARIAQLESKIAAGDVKAAVRNNPDN